jgi:hypothetical protein
MKMIDNKVVSADDDFRASIIAVLVSTDWLLHYGAIMSPDYFESDDEKCLVDWINDYYTKYRAIPELEQIRHGCYGNKLVPSLFAYNETDLRYAADVALDFARMQAMKIAILASVDSIDAGDLAKPLQLVEEARKVGMDRLNLGMELVADAENWMYEQLQGKRVPTGWPVIDMLLGGGMAIGDYGLIMAPTGRGKTTALVNIGWGAAGLLGCVNVLHIPLESSVSVTLKRYAARATGIRLRRSEEFISGSGDYMDMLIDRANRVLRGKIRVVKPGHTLDDIKRAHDNLIAEGFVTGLLIVDYLDLMHPAKKRSDTRYELADMTRDLKAFGEDAGFPVWSGTQVGRQAFTKEVITTKDIAESIEKANASDVIIALCQTEDEEQLGRGRLFMAKVRDAKDLDTFPVKVDKEKQLVAVLND